MSFSASQKASQVTTAIQAAIEGLPLEDAIDVLEYISDNIDGQIAALAQQIDNEESDDGDDWEEDMEEYWADELDGK